MLASEARTRVAYVRKFSKRTLKKQWPRYVRTEAVAKGTELDPSHGRGPRTAVSRNNPAHTALICILVLGNLTHCRAGAQEAGSTFDRAPTWTLQLVRETRGRCGCPSPTNGARRW